MDRTGTIWSLLLRVFYLISKILVLEKNPDFLRKFSKFLLKYLCNSRDNWCISFGFLNKNSLRLLVANQTCNEFFFKVKKYYNQDHRIPEEWDDQFQAYSNLKFMKTSAVLIYPNISF